MIAGKISRFFNSISESIDEASSLQNENKFFAIVMSLAMLTGAVASFLTLFYLLHIDFRPVVFGSSGLFVLAMLFLVFSPIKNEVAKMYLYSMLVSAILVFCFFEYYQVIGPAVWTISFLLVIIIMVYSRIEMLLIFLSTNIILNIYCWNGFAAFDNWSGYHPAHVLVLITFSLAAICVFYVFKNRQTKIIDQLETIRLSEEKLQATLLSVGDGIITIDKNGMVDYLNPVAEKLTGWRLAEAQGEKFEIVFNIINEYSRLPVESPIQKVFETKEIIELANHTLLISLDGTERPIEDTAAPIIDKHGLIVGVVLVFRDFSEKKEKRTQIEYLSYRDYLTGLYNRRFFEEELIRLDTARNLPLSIIFIDVNGLKIINDAFGHQYGDQLIQEVSNGFKEECRADDIIARTGGDEFIILLPKTDKAAVEELVKRIKKRVEMKKILDIQISVSFGTDTKVFEEEDTVKVLKNAEDQMYQRKIIDSSSKRSAVIKSIHNTLLIKSPREAAHAKRVSIICEAVAQAYHLNDDAVNELKIAGELHDIGKIAIDEIVLNKQGELSADDWAQIKQHPEIGYRLLCTTNEYFNIAEYILAHHERWNGTGYPKGISGEEICWSARVITIADAYDAMISERPYRGAYSVEAAIAEIKKNAGIQFDSEIARVFVETVLGFKW